MAIKDIEQLRTYYNRLAWYQKYFLFPWALSSKLTTSTDADICAIYDQVHSSWLWSFYNWVFPELGSFFQSDVMKGYLGPILSEITPDNSHSGANNSRLNCMAA
jgi:hypothetical protein